MFSTSFSGSELWVSSVSESRLVCYRRRKWTKRAPLALPRTEGSHSCLLLWREERRRLKQIHRDHWRWYWKRSSKESAEDFSVSHRCGRHCTLGLQDGEIWSWYWPGCFLLTATSHITGRSSDDCWERKVINGFTELRTLSTTLSNWLKICPCYNNGMDDLLVTNCFPNGFETRSTEEWVYKSGHATVVGDLIGPRIKPLLFWQMDVALNFPLN